MVELIDKHFGSKSKYQAPAGFVDLTDFNIPRKDFKIFVRVQWSLFLAHKTYSEMPGQQKKDNKHQWDKWKNLSAEYQQCLFQYPKIK